MKRFIKFPDIEQFRNIVRNVQHAAQYVRRDEKTGKPIMDLLAPIPIVKAVATEKIHGTNASVCFSEPDGFWVQKRTDLCTPEADNAACAFYAMQNQEAWMDIIRSLANEHNVNLNTHIITVFYEWCGGNIQKNAAVSGLDKMSIIFKHFKVSPVEPSESEPSVWLPTTVNGNPVQNPEARIWNICTFPTYTFEIDFNNPLAVQNYMIELVEKTIEPNSPVGNHFGIECNIGEGIVVTFTYKDVLYTFKVKGEAHSNSKVKTLAPVDDRKLQKVQEVAQKVCPAWRLEQMFAAANDMINGNLPDIRNIGQYLKLVNNDILKEDSDIIAEAGLEPKDVFGSVTKIAKAFYQDALDKNLLV